MPTRCRSGRRSVCVRRNGSVSSRKGRCPKGSKRGCLSSRGRVTSPRSSSKRRTSSRRKSVPCATGYKSFCKNRSTGELTKRRGRCPKGSNRRCYRTLDSLDSDSDSDMSGDGLTPEEYAMKILMNSKKKPSMSLDDCSLKAKTGELEGEELLACAKAARMASRKSKYEEILRKSKSSPIRLMSSKQAIASEEKKEIRKAINDILRARVVSDVASTSQKASTTRPVSVKSIRGPDNSVKLVFKNEA